MRSWVEGLVFLLIISTIWGAAHYYVGRQLIRPLDLSRRGRRWAWALVAVLWALGPTTFVTGIVVGTGRSVSPLVLASYVYMGFFSLVFAFHVVRDLGWLAARLVHAIARRISRRGPADDAPEDRRRRRFLARATSAVAVAASGALSAWGFREAVVVPDVVRVDVPIAGLPPDFDGYTIAQISDIHIGPTIKGDWLALVVARTNELSPDLVAVTGDLVDGSVELLAEDVRPLADLRAPDGAYFVTGNHEYYSGAIEWCELVETLGLHVLVNAHRVVQRGAASMLVAGVTDWTAARSLPEHAHDVAAAVRGAVPTDVKLLLAHQPKSIVDAVRAGFNLQLSGHTHGGQFFPWMFFVRLAQPFAVGLHRMQRTWVYVSPGTGYWGPPHRGGVPSEITLLRLVRR